MNKDELQNLIYLVIDGEATESERTVLFNQLSKDSELQEEFQDALYFNKNMDMEKKTAAPPIAVTASLFGRAGIPMDFLNLKAPEYSHTVGNHAHGTGNILSKIISNKIISAALFFAMGVACTVLFVDIAGNKPIVNGKTVATIFDKKIQPQAIQKEEITPKGDIVKNEVKRIIQVRKKEPYIQAAPQPAQFRMSIENNKEQNNILASLDKSTISISEPQRQPIVPVQLIKSVNKLDLPLENENDFGILNSLTLEVNGIGGIIYFPQRNILSVPPSMNNIKGKIGYYISDYSSIGLEGGIETYPIFVRDKDSNFIPTYSLSYIGGYYKLDLGTYYILGKIVPDIQLFAGGTKTGLVFKGSAGLSFYPEKIIGISFGVENTGVFSSYFSKMNYTNKIGFYYGINIKF